MAAAPAGPVGEKKKGQLFKQLLAEAHAKAKHKQLRPKNLIVLGDEGCGKTELIARIRGKPAPDILGTGLEYSYIDIKDDDSDDIIERMGVYILNGEPDQAGFLDLLLNDAAIEDTLVMLVVDFSRPWTAMTSLERWSEKMVEVIAHKVTPDLLTKLKDARIEAYKAYREPVNAADEDGKAAPDTVVMEADTLKVNMGVPVVIVATKSDAQKSLEFDLGYRQERLDFIQLHLRKFAMQHGASLVYTGKGKSKEVLYQTVVNAAYGTPFKMKANPEDNQGVFIPAGWDSLSKINELTQGFHEITDVDAEFESQIENPDSGLDGVGTGAEEVAQDEQDFLVKQQQLLGRDGGNEPPPEQSRPHLPQPGRPKSTGVPGGTGARPRVHSNPGGGPRKPREGNAVPTGAGASGGVATGGGRKGGGKGKDKDILVDFFNSLVQDGKSKEKKAKGSA
mmetsp:Transcript_19347/g.57505  ORF Transcript_19347/g.57505 Transcript_19347/m.57505 type:complete len:450 (+) Transcript_19347:94-1443(+)